ncbi:MAG: CatA-like O-acetyltransferase, partial [Victivallaceae bacterium]
MNIDSLKMGFNFIDIENWNRREHYLHYMNNVPCGYSFTVELVIEKIKNERLYPAMLWLLTAAVNEFIEFRSALAKDGRLGYFDSMNPTYTIFNSEQKTFSSIWTEFNS